MDTKVIVEKALKGEDYTADVKDFTDEQKISLNREILSATTKAAKEEEVRLVGLRKAGQVVKDQNDKKDEAFAEKLARENRDIAKRTFFSGLKQTLTDKEKEEIQDEFERRKPTHYSVDLLVGEYKKAFGSLYVDKLIEGNEKAVELAKNAAEFNASMAGGSPAISQADADKFSPEAKQLYQDWQKAGFRNKTLDQAQRLVEKGAVWKSNDLTR